MRTTIAVDDALLDELMRSQRGVTRSEAIRRAIQSYLQQQREQEFMSMAGSGLVTLDWRDAERQDLTEVGAPTAPTPGKRRVRRR